MKRKLNNWKKDRKDARDVKAILPMLPNLPALPKIVDLRFMMSKVEDQGELGSCSGNAIVGALEALEIQKHQTFVDLSRLFVYYNERVLENSVNKDDGAFIRDGIKSLVKWGACTEALCPYDIIKFKEKPSDYAYIDGATRKISVYRSVNQNKDDLMIALSLQKPIIFGFQVFDDFDSEEVAKTGVVPMPSKDKEPEGGHAVLMVGYDSDKKVFIVRNSWGSEWGDSGYFTLPFDYVLNPDLADDFWIIG